LRKHVPQLRDIEVEPIVVFLAEDTYVHAEHAPILAVHRKKLKSALRKTAGGKPFTPGDIEQLAKYLKLD
jgi:hypothetical protein